MARLPLVGAWLVYRDRENQHRHHLSSVRSELPAFDPDFRSFLESESWQSELESPYPFSSPDFQLIYLLPFPGEKNSKSIFNSTKVMGHLSRGKSSLLTRDLPAASNCSSRAETLNEYLLLWAYEELSAMDREGIGQQVELLADYLALASESARQREEIRLLEQVVRKGEHQLRHSLGLIALYAETLYRQLPGEKLQAQANVIRETVGELSDRLRDMINCGQQVKLQVAVDDLCQIVNETLQVLTPQLNRKNLRIQYPNRSVNLAIDRWQIKQVFENLLGNAIEFSPPGETIDCNWRVFHNEVLVEIRDRGPGLSPEDLKGAFAPFYSRRSGGTGLGLTIAKKIILDHRGSIWVQNLPEGGAQFSFTLPHNCSYSE